MLQHLVHWPEQRQNDSPWWIWFVEQKECVGEEFDFDIPNGYGLIVDGEEASVEMIGVSVKECEGSALFARSSASVKATQCEFSENKHIGVRMNGGAKGFFTDSTIHHNGAHGVFAHGEGTLAKLRGEQTEMHHNTLDGLSACSSATINIYIPSRSITALVHDNGSDLNTDIGGKILQLSSSSLELTVIHPVPPVDDEADY